MIVKLRNGVIEASSSSLIHLISAIYWFMVKPVRYTRLER